MRTVVFVFGFPVYLEGKPMLQDVLVLFDFFFIGRTKEVNKNWITLSLKRGHSMNPTR